MEEKKKRKRSPRDPEQNRTYRERAKLKKQDRETRMTVEKLSLGEDISLLRKEVRVLRKRNTLLEEENTKIKEAQQFYFKQIATEKERRMSKNVERKEQKREREKRQRE